MSTMTRVPLGLSRRRASYVICSRAPTGISWNAYLCKGDQSLALNTPYGTIRWHFVLTWLLRDQSLHLGVEQTRHWQLWTRQSLSLWRRHCQNPAIDCDERSCVEVIWSNAWNVEERCSLRVCALRWNRPSGSSRGWRRFYCGRTIVEKKSNQMK